jgi:hypothetical protein
LTTLIYSIANCYKIIKEYGSETAPLDLVAITDGAKIIRQGLLRFLVQQL